MLPHVAHSALGQHISFPYAAISGVPTSKTARHAVRDPASSERATLELLAASLYVPADRHPRLRLAGRLDRGQHLSDDSGQCAVDEAVVGLGAAREDDQHEVVVRDQAQHVVVRVEVAGLAVELDEAPVGRRRCRAQDLPGPAHNVVDAGFIHLRVAAASSSSCIRMREPNASRPVVLE
ncbi:hypothetical protein DL765_004027 [Monosporascus sp. GIB2]|nr:hypothetical protein DL765_004027 [Monosporascus sp. GIB2]